MLVRRSRTVICYWDGTQLVVENFRCKALVAATPVAVLLLSVMNDWCSPEQVAAQFPSFSRNSVLRTVRLLLNNGLLVQKHSPEATKDEKLHSSWSAWMPQAAFFHFGTKDVPYESNPRELRRLEKRLSKASPQPPWSKSYSAVSIKLEHPESEAEFVRVLLHRRTHRRFSKRPVSLSTLSSLLYYSWGVTGFLEVPILGRLPLKTSPSAGARHPIETYVLSIRVTGLAPGLYYYNGGAHSLQQLRALRKPGLKAAQFCAGQTWTTHAAALFVMTAVFPRAMWKYPTSRAYRTVLLDAGHVCQSFCLTATWLGLAPFCTMALQDSKIEKELGIDGVKESVLYICGVGLPPDAAASRASLRWASL